MLVGFHGRYFTIREECLSYAVAAAGRGSGSHVVVVVVVVVGGGVGGGRCRLCT